MELEIWRYSSGTSATLGMLMVWRGSTWEMLCFTCEDEQRDVKVPGETRIPAGRYRIHLRNAGGMNARYRVAFPNTHRGMLWLQDVPGFEWVYIHIGNDDDDTEGCILTGEDRYEHRRTIGRSRAAYARIYPEIAEAIRAGHAVWVTIRDCDRMPPADRPHPPEG